MAEENQSSSETYCGWGELVQGEDSFLTFPLTESKTYEITNSKPSDLCLSSSFFESGLGLESAKILIHIQKNGKIEIENASNSSSNLPVFLNENELKSNEKAPVLDKMVIKIGAVSYTYRCLETPGSSRMRTLLNSLQCTVCQRFLENPQSLSCSHVFCQGCVKDLVKAAIGKAPRAVGPELQRYVSFGLDEIGMPSCPVCRKTFSQREATASRPQKILSDITKQFREMIDGRPMCSSCSNQRWIMHGSDYYFCETCQKALCPLCVLDLHRDHKLCSTFEMMLQSSRDYINKCAPSRQHWFDVTKEVEDNKAYIKKTLLWIETFKDQLKRIEQTIEDCVKPSSIAWSNAELLEAPQLKDKIETNRTEALKRFETQTKEARNILPSMTSALNLKLSIINRAKAEIEMFAEVKSAECSSKEKLSEQVNSSETNPPLSSH